jgi:hypothetical protein
MDTAVLCENCGCFSTKSSVWMVEGMVVCAHCFSRMTHDSPYRYHPLNVCEEMNSVNDEFDQILREIDTLRM